MNNKTPVLVVDDDPDDRAFILEALQIAGVKQPIATAANGREAVDKLQDGFGPLSLVLLDIKMPLMDGFQVLEWMQSARPGVPVVILSGSAQPKDIERAYKLGANGFLVKPASIEKLASIMRDVKAFWLDQNYTVEKAKGAL